MADPAPAAGRWEVSLGGSWRAYDGSVQKVLEEAWRKDKVEVSVEIRGQEYVVRLKGQLVQEVKGDASRWRSVRRKVA